MSKRSQRSRHFSTFCVPISAGTFPQTTVIATTSISGDLTANDKAKVSSIPGSQSIITFRIISNLLSLEILSFLFWEVSEPVQDERLDYNARN